MLKTKQIRVYAILQKNEDDSVDLAGCFTDYEVAEKVCKNLNEIYGEKYNQKYYITDTILDFDYQKELGK
jgi:hypothetical protein